MQPEQWLELARHVLLFAVILTAAYTDLARGKIYNWCTLGGLVAGLLLNYARGGVGGGGIFSANLGGSLIATALVALVFAWPYFKGGIAGGDVKLLLAVAAIGGLEEGYIAYALLYCAVIGFVMALAVLIWKRRLLAGIWGALRFTFSFKRAGVEKAEETDSPAKITIPYGLAIAIGSLVAWFIVEVPRW